MGVGGLIMWPFAMAFAGVMVVIAVVVLIFWVWMLVDCSKRKFRNSLEKLVWILVIVLMSWLGAFVYFIVIKSINPRGLANK